MKVWEILKLIDFVHAKEDPLNYIYFQQFGELDNTDEKILTSNSFLVWNLSLVQGFHAQHANVCHPHKSNHRWWFYDQTVFLPNKVAVIFLKICKPFESLQKEFHHFSHWSEDIYNWEDAVLPLWGRIAFPI